MRMHCQGCGQYLPLPYTDAGVGWCSPRCLERFIVHHNLKQRPLPLPKPKRERFTYHGSPILITVRL